MESDVKDTPAGRIDVKFKPLRGLPEEMFPHYATSGSVGLDLRAFLETERLVLEPGGRAAIPTGLAIEILAPGLAGFVFSRSGTGAKHGLTVAQGVGVIDPDYRGEIMVWLLNTSGERREIERGQRIAQLLFLPALAANIIISEELSDTARGAGGFGHTGKH
jgi:dUTP pyrophosphatase